MIRIQLRTTSSPVSGVPSEKVRSSRRRNTIRRPPSWMSHDSASAGRRVSVVSNEVNVS